MRESDPGPGANAPTDSAPASAPDPELDAVVQGVAHRVERLRRELAGLRAELESIDSRRQTATQASP